MREKLKVVTVTLNPALDLFGSIKKLNKNKVNIIEKSQTNPAGKGINVAKILQELSVCVTACGFLGEENQEAFVKLFEKLSIVDGFIRVKGQNRINVKILEQSQDITDLNFQGLTITNNQLEQLENKLAKLLNTHKVFVISGSLPKGVSQKTYKNIIEKLQSKGAKVFFDSSCEALKEGLLASPYLIKPNVDELNFLFNNEIKTKAQIKQAAKKLLTNKGKNVVVSLGENGVLWLDENGWLKADGIKTKVISTVGAGDTLVAGICFGILNNWSKEKTLSFAAALATIAVSQVDVAVGNREDLEKIQKKITITKEI